MTDSRPEITVRQNGVHVWLAISKTGASGMPLSTDIPLSSQEALDVGCKLIIASDFVAGVKDPKADLLAGLKMWATVCGHEADYDEAIIDEAVKLTKELKEAEDFKAAALADIGDHFDVTNEQEPKPETWRDRKGQL